MRIYACRKTSSRTEIPTIIDLSAIIDPSATKKYPSATGSIIVGIAVGVIECMNVRASECIGE